MKKVGIIGLGNIGNAIATAIVEGTVKKAQLVAVCSRSNNTLFNELQNKSKEAIAIYHSVKDFLSEDMDIVIEAANPEVVKANAKIILESGHDFMVMSVGGLIEPGFIEELEEIAAHKQVNVFIPCGSVTGQNIVASGALAGLNEVVIKSIKNSSSFKDAPYIKDNNILLEEITDPEVVFRGNVFEAVQNFPQNVNIAASLALSGFSLDKTQVEIEVDPTIKATQHFIRVSGTFGEMNCTLKLLPSPNKRSAYLATLSAIAALKKYVSPIKFGY